MRKSRFTEWEGAVARVGPREPRTPECQDPAGAWFKRDAIDPGDQSKRRTARRSRSRAECGSAFFADLVAHKEVRETYLNTAAAADLRGRVGEEVSFGGITFRRYRGGLGFGVPTDKAYFYPEGVEGLFEISYAPADTFETAGTVGLPIYARMIPDRDRDEWVRLEIESNPLPICTRPQVLRSARRT
jgi:hypothetical protein